MAHRKSSGARGQEPPRGHRRRRAERARRRRRHGVPAGAPVEKVGVRGLGLAEPPEPAAPEGMERPPAHKISRGREEHLSEWED